MMETVETEGQKKIFVGNDGDGGNRRAKKIFFWEMMETVETEGQKKFCQKRFLELPRTTSGS